jgi:hypothetical protein
MANKPILCAQCKVPAEGPPEPQASDMISCPNCGREETFEDFQRSLQQQGEEYAARVMNKTLSGIAARSSGIKYTPGVVPKRTHNFIVKFE